MSESGSSGDGHTQQAGAIRLSRGASRNASLRNSKEDVSKGNDSNTGGSKMAEEIPAVGQDATGVTIECAVCLQTCVHPVKLPCSHIFCFLCVKGVAFQSRRCAMCRQEIPSDVLLHPQLVDRTQLEKESVLEDGYQWFYEGRNGWWMYDERTSIELEGAYKRSQRIFELLIAGFLYTIDFDQMLQYRKTEPSRRRRIKRDLASIVKKGVAGLRLTDNETPDTEAASGSSQDVLSMAATRAALVNSHCLLPSQTPEAPSNTPQTPQTPRSPPSPAPDEESAGNQSSSLSGTRDISSGDRWQERERRRLRRAVEEIERLRLNDGDGSQLQRHPSRLDANMVMYYQLDEEDANGDDVGLILSSGNQDLWPSGESSTSSSDGDDDLNVGD